MVRSLNSYVILLGFTFILYVLCGFDNRTHGTWIRGNGEPELIECPEGWEEGGRVRLAMGCTAFNPGVLLTRDKYKELILELEARWQSISGYKEQITIYESRIKDLELQLQIKDVSIVECEPCSCFSPVVTGAVVSAGAGLVLGGASALYISACR